MYELECLVGCRFESLTMTQDTNNLSPHMFH